MQIVSEEDNLHDISKPVFWEELEKIYFEMWFGEIFNRHVKSKYMFSFELHLEKCLFGPFRVPKSHCLGQDPWCMLMLSTGSKVS